MLIPSQPEGAPGFAFETWDIDTMQALISVRAADTSTTLPRACLLSAASAHPSISTGKERDTESGNDYFGARYYASGMGRFMSPDWSAKEEPIPYTKLNDPQSLNLYAYVRNNPLTRVDVDGHQAALPLPVPVVPPPPAYQLPQLPPQYQLPTQLPELEMPKLPSIEQIKTDVKIAVTTGVAVVVTALNLPSLLQQTGSTPPPDTNTNTNPFAGPVAGPVTVVDSKGNAIPVAAGQQLGGSKDGKWIHLKDSNGQLTGTRIDGGHPASTHPDPSAQVPHAHVPGQTTADGKPWLPVNQ
jgi:RHS repeat-associated protein